MMSMPGMMMCMLGMMFFALLSTAMLIVQVVLQIRILREIRRVAEKGN